MKVVVIALLTVFLFTFNLFGADSLPDYEPYNPNEFPQWANDLRRGEIILFGTIPFTFFASTILYDFYLFASNSYTDEFAPAILGNKTPPQKSNTEKLQIIAVSVSISAVFSIIDYLLGKPWNE